MGYDRGYNKTYLELSGMALHDGAHLPCSLSNFRACHSPAVAGQVSSTKKMSPMFTLYLGKPDPSGVK